MFPVRLRIRRARIAAVALVAACALPAIAMAQDPDARRPTWRERARRGPVVRPTAHRPRPRRRRRQGWRARRRAEGARGAARADRLHRRHQHGRARRRRATRPASRPPSCRNSCSASTGSPSSAAWAGATWSPSSRSAPASPTATTSNSASRTTGHRAGRPRQHQRHRGPAAQLRGARARMQSSFDQPADSVPRRRDRHGHRQDGGAGQRRPRDCDAGQHGHPGRLRARGHRRAHTRRRRHGAQHPGRRRPRPVRGRRDRRQPGGAARAAREAAVGHATLEPQHGRDDRRRTRRCSCRR